MTSRSRKSICRAALATLLAVMMAVPSLAAQCPACLAGKAPCRHCCQSGARDGATVGARRRDCCRRSGLADSASSCGARVCCDSDDQNTCSCHEQPAERTLPNDRTTQLVPLNTFVALHCGATLHLERQVDCELATTAWLASLFPDIPHRILHCSWLI